MTVFNAFEDCGCCPASSPTPGGSTRIDFVEIALADAAVKVPTFQEPGWLYEEFGYPPTRFATSPWYMIAATNGSQTGGAGSAIRYSTQNDIRGSAYELDSGAGGIFTNAIMTIGDGPFAGTGANAANFAKYYQAGASELWYARFEWKLTGTLNDGKVFLEFGSCVRDTLLPPAFVIMVDAATNPTNYVMNVGGVVTDTGVPFNNNDWHEAFLWCDGTDQKVQFVGGSPITAAAPGAPGGIHVPTIECGNNAGGAGTNKLLHMSNAIWVWQKAGV